MMLKSIFSRISPAWYAVDAGLILCAVFIIQYGFGYAPCVLCVWQRVPWAVLLVLSLIAGRAKFVGAKSLCCKILWTASAIMVFSSGFALYHTGIQYEWWSAFTECAGAVELEQSAVNLLQAVSSETMLDCGTIKPIILGLSMPAWNSIISLYMAISIGYMAWINRT